MNDRYRVEISPLVNGTEATERFLLRFQDEELRVPRDEAPVPDAVFVAWHRREVFRGA